jgi:glycine/D-amino acid oxidase-like deaminating enzyme/nitrite reductase/ring-hydroxylating ferredoxin subunit
MPGPFWSELPFPRFAKLNASTTADVVVVGGGICGLTTACLLAGEGRSVVVLDRDRCASVDTGHTSAHLAVVTDERLHTLVSKFGRSHARAVWDAGLAAITQIERNVIDLDLDARFDWTDGYLYAARDGDVDAEVDRLREDAALAAEFGFDAEFVDRTPLTRMPGVRFGDQARLHPRAYLAGLAQAFVRKGGRIYEHSAASEFRDDPLAVVANGHRVSCGDVVIATHTPLVGNDSTVGAALSQTKLALYTTYVVAGRVGKGRVPDALWWDTADPYRYLRIEPHRDFDVVIFGGEDHKTGQSADTEACYQRVEAQLRDLVGDIELTHRWSGQVIETADGLPYIGEVAAHQFSATGFAGNGLTFGTLAAIMIGDAIAGRRNPWTELFSPDRLALGRSLWDYVKENADYPYYLMRDWFTGADARSVRAVKRGHGAIIERNGAKVAVFRDDKGKVTKRSATCTHMGCIVHWNDAEQTWDCPCHGSRFAPSGRVLAGPAESPLGEAT